MTDMYELTMVDAAIASGTAERKCVFEAFGRRLPGERRYGVVCGTGRLLEAIRDFRFNPEEIDYLASRVIVSDRTAEYLADYRFTGDVYGYAEGECYFPHSPVLTVTGSFAECVVLETVILRSSTTIRRGHGRLPHDGRRPRPPLPGIRRAPHARNRGRPCRARRRHRGFHGDVGPGRRAHL